MDLDKIKDVAGEALDKVSSDKNVKGAVDKAIDAAEKKTKVDLPDVDGIKKILK